MILYRTPAGAVVEHEQRFSAIDAPWEELVNRDDLAAYVTSLVADAASTDAAPTDLLPPIGDRQELWAAGVTYYRSRTARMEEAEAAGGGNFYDRVYHAERPELFMKATPHRVVGHGAAMHLRRDSKWIVPEPELTLVVTRTGRIIGCTAGNDLSCRDIEGENPLYLPQAKTFRQCAAIGPGVLIGDPPPPDSAIRIEIVRSGKTIVSDATDLLQLKKPPQSLVEYLFRDNDFPHGCLLMTGTGIVPPSDFTLQVGDEVRISIDGIGTLINTMQ